MAEKDPAYSFHTEWYDAQAGLVRPYLLSYFLNDGSVEMYDTKNRRLFLKRCQYPGIKVSDLFIGAQITVYARQLKVADYGDDFTRRELSEAQSRLLMVVKPAAFARVADLLDKIYQNQLIISGLKMIQLSEADACEFFGESRLSQRSAELTQGPLVAIEVVGPDVAARLGAVGGPDVHVSTDRPADLEAQFLLRNPRLTSPARIGDGCTVCVIKPHAVMSGVAGKILGKIVGAGFGVTAMQMYNLDPKASKEFHEVYKGVVPDYNGMVEHLASGPCIALELSGDGSTVDAFRDLCGPMDPEIARHIRPQTLRADFGQDRIKNAVHCTDLAEDGPLESEFFFSILQKSELN